MSGKPPKWRPDTNPIFEQELKELYKKRRELIDGKNRLYTERPKVKLSPEQLKEHLNKRREMLDKYDASIQDVETQITSKKEEPKKRTEQIATQGIASLTRRHGGKRRKTKRAFHKK